MEFLSGESRPRLGRIALLGLAATTLGFGLMLLSNSTAEASDHSGLLDSLTETAASIEDPVGEAVGGTVESVSAVVHTTVPAAKPITTPVVSTVADTVDTVIETQVITTVTETVVSTTQTVTDPLPVVDEIVDSLPGLPAGGVGELPVEDPVASVPLGDATVELVSGEQGTFVGGSPSVESRVGPHFRSADSDSAIVGASTSEAAASMSLEFGGGNPVPVPLPPAPAPLSAQVNGAGGSGSQEGGLSAQPESVTIPPLDHAVNPAGDDPELPSSLSDDCGSRPD